MTTADNGRAERNTCETCKYYERREFSEDREEQFQWSCIADYAPQTVSHACCYNPADVSTHPDRPGCRHFEAMSA